STVCKLFAERGIAVIDADAVAKELVALDQPALQAIVQEFGKGIIDAKGRLRRDRLRSIVFSDPERRKRLEKLLHPLILKEMLSRANRAGGPYCILCIPLLVETDQSSAVDRVLVVDAPQALQIQRVMERDHLTIDEIKAIMHAQASREDRLEAADDVIMNASDMTKLAEQVNALHQKYLALPTR
ncbi:MAG TPA: dephospho-CoA kinase, partial [Gammaproteobacteria bacterium]|nr:dephospho-CoA kinase [Gammaproteobacteria bacterium]